jgi:hypothetical protein
MPHLDFSALSGPGRCRDERCAGSAVVTAIRFLCVAAAVAFAVYWFGLRGGGCGKPGAVACPAPELEEGVGVTLNPAEVCRGAGYLCAGRGGSFQIARWQLDKGKLRVRVRLPEFVDAETAREIRDAAIEGIMEWNGHPFPLVIDTDKFTFRFWDIGVVWSQGLYSDNAGVLNMRGTVDGKRFVYGIDGMAVVVPPIAGAALLGPASDPAALRAQVKAMGRGMGQVLLTQVKAVAMHEMGHALGLMHSDSEDDIMFPQYRPGVTQVRISRRDLRTVEALYALPNGAMVQ